MSILLECLFFNDKLINDVNEDSMVRVYLEYDL